MNRNRSPETIRRDVQIHGNVDIGEGVSICEPADINGVDSMVRIGDGCDIAAFVTITCADSHRRCIGISTAIERRPVFIEDHVFIGQGATILGGCRIGHHSVIGAGVVLKSKIVPPYSRVRLPEPIIEEAFYARPE